VLEALTSEETAKTVSAARNGCWRRSETGPPVRAPLRTVTRYSTMRLSLLTGTQSPGRKEAATSVETSDPLVAPATLRTGSASRRSTFRRSSRKARSG